MFAGNKLIRNFLNLSDIKIGQLKKILARATYLKSLEKKIKTI